MKIFVSVFFGIIAAVLVLYLAASAYLSWSRHDTARQKAKELMENAYLLCNPQTAQDPQVVAVLEDTERALGALPLDWTETDALQNQFTSQLNLRGCGYEARHRLDRKANKRRK